MFELKPFEISGGERWPTMVGIGRPKKLKLYSWAAGHAFGRSEGIQMLHVLLIGMLYTKICNRFTEGFEMI